MTDRALDDNGLLDLTASARPAPARGPAGPVRPPAAPGDAALPRRRAAAPTPGGPPPARPVTVDTAAHRPAPAADASAVVTAPQPIVTAPTPTVGGNGSAAAPDGPRRGDGHSPGVPAPAYRPARIRPEGIPLTPLFGASRDLVTHGDAGDGLAGEPDPAMVGRRASGRGADATGERAGRRWPAGGTSRARVLAFVLAGSVLPGLAFVAVTRATATQSLSAGGPRPSSVLIDGVDGAAGSGPFPLIATTSPPSSAEGTTSVPETPGGGGPSASVPASTAPSAATGPAPTTASRSGVDVGPAPAGPPASADLPGRGNPPRNGRPSGPTTPSTTSAGVAPTTAPRLTPAGPTAAESAILACARRLSGTDTTGSAAAGYGVYRLDAATWDDAATALSRSDLVGVRPDRASSADQDLVALQVLRTEGASAWPGCA